MEAMIVPPVQEPKAFTPKNKIENKSGSESTFAPTLDQAIKDKKSSAESTNSNSSKSAKVNKSSQDDSNTTSESETAATQNSGVLQKIPSETDSNAASPSENSKIVSAQLEETGRIKVQEAGLPKAQRDTESSAATQTNSSEVNEKNASKLNSSNSTKDPIVSAQFTQTLGGTSDTTKGQVTSEETQKSRNTVYVQNGDTIHWKESKSSTPNMLSQNTTLQQLNSEYAEGNKAPAIRVERFSHQQEAAAQNNSEKSDKLPPLSAERIAAKLTDIPLQANHATSLRDNQPSIRQDTHAQFLDAKVDHIEKMQLGQAEQQSLNSDNDSTQKDALTASPKNIEKPSDVSFSQSLHSVSTDKSSSSAIEAFRPGGSAFTSQIHENNILHQVIHKFRISQHLQDSRVVMKLHPAELGDLKIDVQLKDGVINANILAQTQQVQDILEKNMPRLKALMEEQGLMVNEIAIKLDTDVSDNKNMFEDHLAQDEKSFAPKKNVVSSVKFELEEEAIEDAGFAAQAVPSGVNVMI